MSSMQAHLGRLRATRDRTNATPNQLMRNAEFQRHAILFVASHLDELAQHFGSEEPTTEDNGLPAEWFATDAIVPPMDAGGHAQVDCGICKGHGFYGIPGGRCEFCRGTGKVNVWRPAPDDSGVIVAGEAQPSERSDG